MLAGWIILSLGQSQVKPAPQCSAQYRDPYAVRIGGARLTMTRKEFDRLVAAERQASPTHESLLAKADTYFVDGHLTSICTEDPIPNSNVPMPGTNIDELRKISEREGLGWVGVFTMGTSWTSIGDNSVSYNVGGNAIHRLYLGESDIERWGIWLKPARLNRAYDSSFRTDTLYVQNKRSVPIDVTLNHYREEITMLNAYTYKTFTIERLMPGENRAYPLVMNRHTSRSAWDRVEIEAVKEYK